MCAAGKGRYGTFLADISEFYCDFHHKCYGKHLVYMHDPAAMLAVIRKDLFEWEKGPALVAVNGPMRGKTLVDCAPLHVISSALVASVSASRSWRAMSPRTCIAVVVSQEA